MHRQRTLMGDSARSASKAPIRTARDAIETPSKRRLDRTKGQTDPARRPSISPQSQRPASIPIEPAAPPRHTARDFVPWRFSDAGRRARGDVRAPASEKPCMGLPKSSPDFAAHSTSFLFGSFLWFNLADGFLPSQPQFGHAGARRGGQGRPSRGPLHRLRRFQAVP
jgi:hypothetical protein